MDLFSRDWWEPGQSQSGRKTSPSPPSLLWETGVLDRHDTAQSGGLAWGTGRTQHGGIACLALLTCSQASGLRSRGREREGLDVARDNPYHTLHRPRPSQAVTALGALLNLNRSARRSEIGVAYRRKFRRFFVSCWTDEIALGKRVVWVGAIEST